MGDVVNLRLARKAKARSEAEQAAAESRAVHGRSKSEKTRSKAVSDALRNHLDAHKREEPD